MTTPNFSVTTDGTNGTATIDATTGAWSYTPDADFNGSDSFIVSVTDDDGNVETLTIGLTVNQVNDTATFSGDTSGSGAEDGGPITGTLSVADTADGMTTPNFSVTTDGVNGTATIDATTGAWSYTPDADFNGSDSFIVSVTDDDGNVETQTIGLTVNQVNDIATFSGDTSGSGAEDGGPITGTLSVADTADGMTTPNFSVTTDGVNGTATIDATTGTWSYTPDADFNGSDSFIVSVTDDDGNVESQTIGLTVNQVNDTATFSGDTSGSGAEDGGPITGTLSVADTADGMTTPNFSVTTDGVNGTATIDATTGAWSYTPDADFNGSDSFIVSVTDDDGNVETQTIGLTVNQVNDTATFSGDTSGSGAEDGGPITGTLSVADTADGMTTPNFNVTTDGVNGTATIDATTGAWSYTPDADFNGSDSFIVSVIDDDGNVESQTIGLAVTPIDDPALISGDTGYTGNEGDTGTGDLNATDVEGLADGDYFNISTQGMSGTASIDPLTGAWRYTSTDPDWFGADSFEVTVTDDLGGTTTQAVNIALANVDDPAVISGQTAGTVRVDGATTVSGALSISDVDPADTPSFPDVPATTSASGYGTFAMSGGAWTFVLNNAHTEVLALQAGESLSDAHIFVASDGSPRVVTVVIDGPEAVEIDPVIEEPRPEPEPEPEPEVREPPPVAEQPPEAVVAEVPTETEPLSDPLDDAGVVVPPGPVVVPDEVVLSVLAERQPDDRGVQQKEYSVDKPDEVAAQTFLQELKSFWVDVPEPRPQLSEVRLSQAFWDGLDKLADDLDEAARRDETRTQLSAEAAAGIGISLTAGFVSWALRAGSMAASFLAAMPTWRNFDPMPILAADDEDEEANEDKEGEEREDEKVDELFEH